MSLESSTESGELGWGLELGERASVDSSKTDDFLLPQTATSVEQAAVAAAVTRTTAKTATATTTPMTPNSVRQVREVVRPSSPLSLLPLGSDGSEGVYQGGASFAATTASTTTTISTPSCDFGEVLYSRLLLSVAFFVVVMYLSCVLEAYVWQRTYIFWVFGQQYRRLPDLGFDLLPKLIPFYPDKVKYVVTIFIVFTLIRFTVLWLSGISIYCCSYLNYLCCCCCCICGRKPAENRLTEESTPNPTSNPNVLSSFRIPAPPHSVRYSKTTVMAHMWRRWLLCTAVAVIIQKFCDTVTMLPNPEEQCIPDVNRSCWIEGWYILTYQRKSCNGILYGNYATFVTMTVLLWQTYAHMLPLKGYTAEPSIPEERSEKQLWLRDIFYGSSLDILIDGSLQQCSFFKLVIWILGFTQLLLIIRARLEYTVNVLLEFVIAFLIWETYHRYIRSRLGPRTTVNWRITFWRWMEQGAPDFCLYCLSINHSNANVALFHPHPPLHHHFTSTSSSSSMTPHFHYPAYYYPSFSSVPTAPPTATAVAASAFSTTFGGILYDEDYFTYSPDSATSTTSARLASLVVRSPMTSLEGQGYGRQEEANNLHIQRALTSTEEFTPSFQHYSITSVLLIQILLRWILTLLYFIPCVYFNCVMQAYAAIRSNYYSNLPEGFRILPDLGFEWIPSLPYSLPNTGKVGWADLWLAGYVGITIVRFLASGIQSAAVFRRWTTALASLFMLRGVCIIVTMLPNPFLQCIANIDGGANAWKEGWYIMSLRHITCADVLFSGHTVNLTLTALVWQTYHHKTKFLHWEPSSFSGRKLRSLTQVLTWTVALLGMFIIISTHFHYSIDVIVGFVLTYFFWKLYHYSLWSAGRRKDCISRGLAWLETNKVALIY